MTTPPPYRPAIGPTADDDRFARTVPRQLVHRASVSEVLVTGWRVEDDDVCAVDAQWPRNHGFYVPIEDTWHDPVLALETVRQASMVAAFQAFGAAPDTAYLVHELRYTGTPEGLRLDAATPELGIRVVGTDIMHRGSRLRSMSTTVHLRRGSVDAGTGFARFSCLSQQTYRRLRDTSTASAAQVLPEPVDLGSVGRHRTRDVMLAPTGEPGVWLLRVDPDHPTLFDHPLDHIPGMALVEAARQAAHTVSRAAVVLPVELSARFHAYVELDGEALVRVAEIVEQTSTRLVVLFVVEQHGKIVADVLVRALLR